LSWLARVFRKTEGRALDLPEHVRTLRELKAGERGRVMCLGATSDRDNSLAVFGLAPGAEIMLLQHQPACVVQIGETQLALDPEIAESILVDEDDGDLEWLKGR
jgi:Fe2+ transport system protein FeoA